MACLTSFVLGILVGIAPSETAHGTPSVFTWASASTGASWLNSANWGGGPVNKAPGVDSNASSTVDNDPNDTATIGTVSFSGNNLSINFNTSVATGVGNNTGAN